MNQSALCIPTFEELLDSLPERFRTEKVQRSLKNAYDREVSFIKQEITHLEAQAKPYQATMNTFNYREGDPQAIADFAVKDLSRPQLQKFNWHLQNTSQWTYAGCILFSRPDFEADSEHIISTHH